MKITKRQLRRLIREELSILSERATLNIDTVTPTAGSMSDTIYPMLTLFGDLELSGRFEVKDGKVQGDREGSKQIQDLIDKVEAGEITKTKRRESLDRDYIAKSSYVLRYS